VDGSVLVTGGAGYIGSVSVELLVQEGYRVVVLDDLSVGHGPAVAHGVPLIVGDIGDRELVDRVLREHSVSAVIHFAARSLVAESMERPAEYYDSNVIRGCRMLSAMAGAGVDRIVFSSSAGVYGEPASVPVDEGQATEPVNVYGDTKRVFENVLEWQSERVGLRYVSLRYFNAAGATELHGEDHRPETHLIPMALQAAAGRRPGLTVFGSDYDTPDGTCIRDYVDVRDLADAHILALRRIEAERSGVYNLGNGEGSSVLDVIRAVESVTGKTVPWERGDRREGDPARLVASSELAERELGWRRSHPELSDMIGSAWEWMERNPDGYTD
jgi:UDP-glucose 4-epimerase